MKLKFCNYCHCEVSQNVENEVEKLHALRLLWVTLVGNLLLL